MFQELTPDQVTAIRPLDAGFHHHEELLRAIGRSYAT